jgi:hypothetical protein
MNATDTLSICSLAASATDLFEISPVPGRIWARMQPGDGVDRMAGVIDELGTRMAASMEGGSWTSNLTGRGYTTLGPPMGLPPSSTKSPAGDYRPANDAIASPLHLLASQRAVMLLDRQ